MLRDGHLWASISLALIPIGFAFAMQWLTQSSPLATRLQGFKGLVAPFFVSIGILFGLFAVFVTNDVWVIAHDRAQEVEQSLDREASAVRSVELIATAIGSDGDAVQASLNDYVAAALAAEGEPPSDQEDAAVNGALQRLVNAILSPALSPGSHAVAQRQMLRSYAEIQYARAERAALLPFTRDPYKWSGMIILGLLTQAAIAMGHIDNRKAEAAALTLFTSAFVVAIVVFALAEHEVARLAVGSPEALRRLLL